MREISKTKLPTYYITEDKDVSKYLKKLPDQLIAVDTETTGLDPMEEDVKLRLVQIANKEISVIFDIFTLGQKSKDKIRDYLSDPDKVKILHNAKFDIKFLKTNLGIKHFQRVFCSFIGSQLLSCGLVYNQGERILHGLGPVVERYLGEKIEKGLGASDWKKPKLSNSQLRYASDDVGYLHKLREVMIPEMRRLGLLQITKIEFDCIEPTAEMELNGFTLDVKRWESNMRRMKARCIRTAEKIMDEMFPVRSTLFKEMPEFKLSSPDQLAFQLEKMGIELPKMWDSKSESMKKTTRTEKIAPLADEWPVIGKIIKWKTANKALTSFGKSWLKKVNKLTKRIHASYKQIGALTGRFACTKPNLQQIPRENRYRTCFISGEGRSLVWADYSQMELRILAELSADVKMIQAFKGGYDFHTYTAGQVHNISYENVESVHRKLAKNLNFGMVYGIGLERFAVSAGLSEEDAQEVMNSYFRSYPRMKQFLDYSSRLARVHRKSTTMAGRLVKYSFNENNKRAVSEVSRNGKNTPIQGTNAEITKFAMKLIFDEIYNSDSIKIIHCLHDEIVMECDDKDVKETEEILNRCMIDAGKRFLKQVPIVVESKIAKRWSK